MNKVKVLVEGYVQVKPGGKWVASSTTTLITTTKGEKIIVDPGCNEKLLLNQLKKRGLNLKI